MWAAAAAREVLPDQQGSAVALRLGGAARSLAREIPDVQLRHGAIADPETADAHASSRVSSCC